MAPTVDRKATGSWIVRDLAGRRARSFGTQLQRWKTMERSIHGGANVADDVWALQSYAALLFV